MNESWEKIGGVILKGHGVASGTGTDRRYPAGTLQMQRPFFASLGLDLAEMHGGTLNISIAPFHFILTNPAHTFRRVEWTDLHPPEDFSFSRCRLIREDGVCDGWVYTPHPETKAAHFHPPAVLEIIAPFIPGLAYGDRVELLINSREITILNPAS